MSLYSAQARKIVALALGLWFMSVVPGAGAEERFSDQGDGTVIDRKLGLMWAAFDNQGDVDWKGARRYCRVGPPQVIGMYDNWRMPTPAELESLYRPESEGYETPCGQTVRIDPAITLSCGWVWSSEVRSITAAVFNFHRGYMYTDRMVHYKAYRALPVRDLSAAEVGR
jgi:hypothetical protein